jgi:phosphate transport system protein
MRSVLIGGDQAIAAVAIAADDDIDDMSVSLTERCYDLLAREHPVAGDLRFVVSVLRVLGEFERVGDLALRVVKVSVHHDVIASNPSTHELLIAMADDAIDRYRVAMRAWSATDAHAALELQEGPALVAYLETRLTNELLALERSDAAEVAIRTLVAGRSLERIADHAGIIGARLLFLLTGDSEHLASEVR